MVNQILLGLVQSVLGRSNPTARGNHSFNCPFCNHKTPKLEVNLIPNKNVYHHAIDFWQWVEFVQVYLPAFVSWYLHIVDSEAENVL